MRSALLAFAAVVLLALPGASATADFTAAGRSPSEAESSRAWSDGEAIDIAVDAFGQYLTAVTGGELDPARIKRFASDHAAVVSGHAGPLLIESTVPLRAIDRAGRNRAVDLSLRRLGAGLIPENPLVPLSLPSELGEGVSLPSADVRITLPEANPHVVPFIFEERTAIYPNVERGVTLAIAPVANGFETFTVLNEQGVSHSQTFALDMPEEADLGATPDGGAEAVASGRAILSVSPPSAIDAAGIPVETSLEVEGRSLRIEVSPTFSTKYPLLVDPIYQTYNWSSGTTTGLSDWTKTSNTAVYTPATQLSCGSNCVSPFQTNGTPGLYVGGTSGAVAAGATAYWNYFVPRYQADKSKYGKLPSSFISSAEFSSVQFFHRTDSAASPGLFAGLWAGTEAPSWGGVSKWVSLVTRYGNQTDWTGSSFTLSNGASNQAAKWVLAGMLATDNHSLTAYRDAYFGGSKIALTDTGKPVLTGVTAPSGWFDQSAPPISLTAEDTGLGVHSFKTTEVAEPFNTGTYWVNCLGTAADPCPRVWSSTEGSPPSVPWPSALPEGVQNLSVVGQDPVGNSSEPSYVQVKIDHSAPSIALSGPLTQAGPKRLDPGKYNLHVAATDGSEANPRSGVKSIAIEVDGVSVPGTVEQSCPAGSCSGSSDWNFDVSSYSNGEHLVTVIVKDQVGRQSKSELKVTVDKSKLYWGARMDGDVQLLKEPPQSPIGDAPWEKATWEEFKEHAGGKYPSIIHFGQPAPWNQEFFSSPFDKTYEKKAIPLLSMGSGEVSLEDIAAGEGEEYEQLVDWIVDVKNYGKPFFFRWNWEMNLRPNDELPWTKQIASNPKAFVDAWRKFRQVADEKGATNITWVWCPNISYGSYPEGSTPLSQLWPGSEYVDWTCIDGYNRGTNPIQSDEWKSFSTVFKKTYEEVLALAPSKPIMIGETASSEIGGSKAEWITEALAEELPVDFPKVEALVWFNWNIEKPSGSGKRLDWPIESSSSAREAFASAIGSPNYASGEFESLPSLTRIQPLP